MSHIKEPTYTLLKSEADYEAALARIDALWDDASPNSPQEQEIELLALLVEIYEEEHYPIPPPHPIEAIKFRMEQLNLKQQDLMPYIGYSGRVSEVLNGKRKLSLNMIRKLHKHLNIPLASLVAEYE